MPNNGFHLPYNIYMKKYSIRRVICYMSNKTTIPHKLNKIFAKKDKLYFTLIMLTSIAMSFLHAISVASMFPFIDMIMNPGVIHSNKWLFFFFSFFNFSSTSSFTIFSGALVFFSILLSNSLSLLLVYGKTKFTNRNNYLLSGRLLKKYMSKDYLYFLNKNTSELSKNILTEANEFTGSFLMPLLMIITNLFMITFIISTLLIVDFKNTIFIMIFAASVLLVFKMLFGRKITEKGSERRGINKRRHKLISESLSGIKTIKAFNIEEYFINQYSKSSRKLSKINVYVRMLETFPKKIIEVILFGGIVVFLISLILSERNIQEIIPLVGFFVFAIYKLMPVINSLFKEISDVYYHIPILDRIYEDLIEEKEEEKAITKQNNVGVNDGSLGVKLREGSREERQDIIEFKSEIRIEGISFTYPKSERLILNDLSLEIQKNKIVSFVGATGSGKTTLIDIILGLLKPQSGSIVVDGVYLDESNISSWQKHIGYVPQDVYITDDTIEKNVAFGIPDNEINKEKVRNVLKMVSLYEFIENELPDKFETKIGERGIRFSGGQKQRIGLARALYRDPSVLILDEATSALDNKTESDIVDTIKSLSKEMTIIMIAHRLTTVKESDVIYFLSNGCISGCGTYDELLENNAEFRELSKSNNN
jgi:ATP-binding cassette, subfamily B, bacterial PglK